MPEGEKRRIVGSGVRFLDLVSEMRVGFVSSVVTWQFSNGSNC
jgi:hypothetical protein